VILVLNAGSSSLKYRLVDLDHPADSRGGIVERIDADQQADALRRAFAELRLDPGTLRAVGHRVVHGGDRFLAPVLLDDEVSAAIAELAPLAPLHNPANHAGIEAARALFPDVPQVAVFDTAFHATLPPAAATYAIDRATAQRYRIRRYGFHGISHEYVAGRTATLLGRPLADLRLIVLHLGNGASATAILGGRSVETSMGFTPLEGLVMGTRAGDLDPGLVQFLVNHADGDLLQHGGGLAGLCGANDMRTVLDRRGAGDPDASLAFDVYCHRIRKYVGAYHAVLGRVDAITFTAGVGEHAAPVRAAALAGLTGWGIAVDPVRNTATVNAPRVISPDGTAVAVCVVPTDEETAIARATAALVGGRD
jgi:acetate kinase